MQILGLFAKYWQPGRVKTRLAAAVGAQAAAGLYREFVATLVGRLEAIGDRRCLVHWPPESADAFAALAGTRWQTAPQAAGDLGARMQQFFVANLAPATRVVLIGSDSPNLPIAYLREAFDRLNEQEVVLGPARDGGYYLVGARATVPPIFTGIPWSTEDVWPSTIARLEQAGRSYAVLPAWYDVDTLEDLQQLDRELRQSRDDSSCRTLAAATASCLRDAGA